jgi:hypothetical protein
VNVVVNGIGAVTDVEVVISASLMREIPTRKRKKLQTLEFEVSSKVTQVTVYPVPVRLAAYHASRIA